MTQAMFVVFGVSPPLSHTCLAIRSGQSHPGSQTQPQPVRHRFESLHSRAIRPPDRHGRVRAVRDCPSNAATTCHRPSCGVVKHLFSRTPTTSGASSGTNVSWDRVPRGPSSTKGRIKVEPERSQQARGVPGVARCQTVRAWFGHESSRSRRFAMQHHPGDFGGPFPSQDMDLPKKSATGNPA